MIKPIFPLFMKDISIQYNACLAITAAIKATSREEYYT